MRGFIIKHFPAIGSVSLKVAGSWLHGHQPLFGAVQLPFDSIEHHLSPPLHRAKEVINKRQLNGRIEQERKRDKKLEKDT